MRFQLVPEFIIAFSQQERFDAYNYLKNKTLRKRSCGSSLSFGKKPD